MRATHVSMNASSRTQEQETAQQARVRDQRVVVLGVGDGPVAQPCQRLAALGEAAVAVHALAGDEERGRSERRAWPCRPRACMPSMAAESTCSARNSPRWASSSPRR